MAENSREYVDGNEGGCRAKDVHDEMRQALGVDVGGKETTTKKLMKPQTENPEAYDG